MPGKVREIVIKPPAAGVVRRFDFQSQPPFSSVDALNFWPFDSKTGRRRPTTRPRLATYGSGPAARVRGLAQVNVATQQTLVRGLFATAGGVLYRYDAGTFTSEGNGGTAIATDRYVSMAPFLQKLYVAGATEWHEYDCVGDTMTYNPAATAGTKPQNTRILAVWRDRMVASGDPANPHIWYMSRVGDPLDHEYGLPADDVSQAVASTNLDGGNLGEKITAIIPHNNECVIFGGTDSLHIIRGDPMQGGRLEILSQVVGPIGPSAWCKTGQDETILLTRNGLYVMAPGCGAPPVPLSKQRIPDELVGIDTGTYNAFLSYDTRFDGVHIYVTETAAAGSGRQAWWLDWEDGGYWPMELTTTEQPQSILRFDPLDGDDVSGVLLGSNSSGVYRFDRTSASSIASGYLYLGPFKLSPTRFHKGIIQKMTAVFSASTNDTSATVDIYCAESGEAAYDAAVADTKARKFSTTVGQLQSNHCLYPRVGGHAAVIKIAMADGTKHLSAEEFTLTVLDQGTYR